MLTIIIICYGFRWLGNSFWTGLHWCAWPPGPCPAKRADNMNWFIFPSFFHVFPLSGRIFSLGGPPFPLVDVRIARKICTNLGLDLAPFGNVGFCHFSIKYPALYWPQSLDEPHLFDCNLRCRLSRGGRGTFCYHSFFLFWRQQLSWSGGCFKVPPGNNPGWGTD